MSFKDRYIDKIPPWLRNKYILTIILLFIWLLLFDANNLFDRIRDLRLYKGLQRDTEYYSNRIEEDNRKLMEIRSGNESLEKFAREQYRMKKSDEDIYIIVTPEEERRIRRERN